jgi:hypothetical protein
MRSRWLAGALLAAVGSNAGCHGAPPPPANPPYAARPVVEIGRFEARQDGALLGHLVHYEIEDPSGPIRFWRVEDGRGAWVGHVSQDGRFTRRVPFRDDEEDLGLWPMAKGVAHLFERDGAVELKEVPVAVPAVARKQR